MLARRSLFAVVPFAALAACGGVQPDAQKIQMIAGNVQILASGLSKTLVQLSALNLPGLTPALLDIAQTALGGLQAAARDIGAVSTVAEAQPIVARVVTYVNTLIGTLSVLPLPPELKTALAAASILLPIIQVAVNMLPQQPPVTPPTSPPMTPDQARAALK